MKIAIFFGGSGYIGKNIIFKFLELKIFDKIIIGDIKPSDIKNENVEYFNIDVRKKILLEVGNIDQDNSWIFNLAAIHREPGH